MSRVSDEMASDTRREPRRIARSYSEGRNDVTEALICQVSVETRMGSDVAGGLLWRCSLVWRGPHVARSLSWHLRHPIPPRRCAARTGLVSGC